MSEFTKVLFIGLDSVEPDLLLEWIDAGALPTFRSLKDNGLWGPVAAQPGFGNGTMWASLCTSVNPAKHGRYFFKQVMPGSYELTPFNEDTDLRHEPFWAVLSRADRRVAIIDMVRAPLTSGINGIQLADWTTHDRTSPTRSWPSILADQVIAQFGTDPVNGYTTLPKRSPRRTPEEYRLLRDQLIDRVKVKTDLSCYYLEQGGWDLFATVFGEPHDIGHQCWHLHDPTHPLHDPDWRRRLGDPIKDVYVALDTALASLLERAGEATVVVFAGPGMEPRYTASNALDTVLCRLEGCRPVQGTTSTKKRLKSIYKNALPDIVRKRIRTLFNNRTTVMRARNGHRKFFAVPHNENSGAIRINLMGREPNGQVRPGADYDKVCAQLTQDLLELVDLDSGKPVVKEVVQVCDVYKGQHIDLLPDLLAVWNRNAPITWIGSPKVGRIKNETLGSRTGDHTPNAMFFAHGPHINPGRLLHEIPVEAIAPSLAALLGVPLPEADAAPIEALQGTFKEAWYCEASA
jgi:predicted AlkP superfamily phosphohydrolase/phosphomutase